MKQQQMLKRSHYMLRSVGRVTTHKNVLGNDPAGRSFLPSGFPICFGHFLISAGG